MTFELTLKEHEAIFSQFSKMQEKLPTEYFKRNHLQYEYVSYVSIVFTLFLSKKYELAGRFIVRAMIAFEKYGPETFDTSFITESKLFLKLIMENIILQGSISDKLRDELNEYKNLINN